jgi:hypothetical protein
MENCGVDEQELYEPDHQPAPILEAAYWVHARRPRAGPGNLHRRIGGVSA